MADSQSIARFLNPWALHLQKLGLELKCPICLKLLEKPVLLPCDHIFCNSCVPECTKYESECLVCNHQFINQDIRPAPYIENIASIYRSMDSALSAVSPSLSGEMRPCLVGKKVDGRPSAEKDVNHLSQQSPASYITSDDYKEVDANMRETEYQNLGFEKKTANMSSMHVDGQLVNTSETKCRSREDDDDESLERDNKRHKKSNGHSDVTVSDASLPVCAFCKSSNATDASGPILFYTQGKETVESLPDSIPVHRRCIDWAPQIYYEGDIIKNFKSELTRSAKLKCNECGQKGAALGCYMKSCPRTYHPPCAFESEECRWDMDNFLMLCPSHTSERFLNEKPKSRKSSIVGSHKKSKLSTEQSNFYSTPNGPKEWVLCGSALSPEDKCTLVEFGKMCGATVSKLWTSDVTHVIAAVDSEGACARTLKVLMAILCGKWIISMDWVRACLEAKRHVNEEPYEINLDNHGCCDGPKNGRLRASTNAPKLFENLRFYPSGDFVGPFLKDLLELVKVAGGTVVERKEDLIDAKGHKCLIVYNCDPLRVSMPDAERYIVPKRLEEAEDLAKRSGSLVIKHTWILESIAACSLVPFA